MKTGFIHTCRHTHTHPSIFGYLITLLVVYWVIAKHKETRLSFKWSPCLYEEIFRYSEVVTFGSFFKIHFLCEPYLVIHVESQHPPPDILATKSHLINMTLFNTHQSTYTFHILFMKLTFINKHRIFSLFFSLFCLAS